MTDKEAALLHLLTEVKWDVLENGCWEWNKGKAKGGYGKMSTQVEGRSVTVYASRVALRSKLDREIGHGMQALHTCDNPPCVNPDHLYEGTPKQNTSDMITRGRRADSHIKGGLATRKLTLEQVLEIRERVTSGAVQAKMSEEYGVSKQTISNVVNGALYGLPGAVPHRQRAARRKFDDEVIIRAKKLASLGVKLSKIEKDFGMSAGTMSRIMSGKLYADVA